MHITYESVARNLASFERLALGEVGESRHAAVTLTLVAGDNQPELLITRRASTLRAHAGQWALPGGRLDPGESVAEAAVRELSEEVGLTVGVDAVMGELDAFVTRSGFCISPVVVWAVDVPFVPAANEGEVASVHRLTADDLLTEPRFISIPESDRPVIQMPINGSRIHAPTGAILYQFAEVALRGRSTRVSHYEQPVFAWK